MKQEKKNIDGTPTQLGLYLRRIMEMAVWPAGMRGHRLESITLKRKDTGVLIILKKSTPQGNKVAFVDGRDWTWALWATARRISSNTLRWRESKF